LHELVEFIIYLLNTQRIISLKTKGDSDRRRKEKSTFTGKEIYIFNLALSVK